MSKTKELVEIIERKDREIRDIKYSVADVLEMIRRINESNIECKQRKISELCTDTRYELLVDELKEDTSRRQTKLVSSK